MRTVARRRSKAWIALAVLVLALLYGWIRSGDNLPEVAPHGTVERLYEERRSGVVVEGRGIVERVLPDDVKGSKHQRFLLRLQSGHTLLISHNIDLAPRVAGIARGDEVSFRGQYEWNDRGGVVHWTHRDPAGKRSGGWLRHEQGIYR
jgi:hypothetical protein